VPLNIEDLEFQVFWIDGEILQEKYEFVEGDGNMIFTLNDKPDIDLPVTEFAIQDNANVTVLNLVF